MARPEEELVANGASETNLETKLLSDNQQDVIAEASDGDGGERPVREKLKKTSIASLAQYTNSRTNAALQSDELSSTTESQGEQADITNDARGAMRGRPARKRSFDDLQKGDIQSINTASHMSMPEEKGSHHKRMRSRDTSSGEGMVSNGQPGTEPLEYHDDEEENDGDARRSPGGPGVLVEPPAMTETTPPRTQVRADNNAILSPKKKRSRDQFDKDQDPKDEGSDISGDSIVRSGSEPAENDEQIAQTTSRTATGEPEKKRPRDEELQSEISKTTQEVEPSSGFANTATASPFATFSRSKSPLTADASFGKAMEKQAEKPATSTSAFASSGLSAFSILEKSPFSTLSSNSAGAPGGFGSLASSEHTTSGFGSSGGFGGTSPFSAKTSSGFGGLGSSGFGGLGGSSLGGTLGGVGGFGGPRPLGRSLSSFAAPPGSATTFGGASSAKAFGAPAQEDEGDSEDDDGDDSDDEAAIMDRPKDRRFHEQELETGEEAEETVFSCRAKLYHFEGKEWKERGVGTFKINTAWAPSSEESSERKSRLIMRTDGVHRVVLNTPIFKGMKVGTPEGNEPTGKTLNITGMEAGKPTLFALKIGKEEVVKDLYHKIMDLQAGF